MNIELAKKIVSITAQLGTGAISAAVIQNNVPNRNLITKITVPVAGFMIGGLAAKNVSAYSDEFMDEVAGFLTAAKTATENPDQKSV